MENFEKTKLYKEIAFIKCTDYANMHLKLNGFIPKDVILIPNTVDYHYWQNPAVFALVHQIRKWDPDHRLISCEFFTVNENPGYKMILHPHELSIIEANPADALAWMWIELVKDGALVSPYVPDKYKDAKTLKYLLFPELRK